MQIHREFDEYSRRWGCPFEEYQPSEEEKAQWSSLRRLNDTLCDLCLEDAKLKILEPSTARDIHVQCAGRTVRIRPDFPKDPFYLSHFWNIFAEWQIDGFRLVWMGEFESE